MLVPVVYKTWVTLVCLLTRPLGGGRWGHYLCNLWGECFTVHKTVCQYLGIFWDGGAIYAGLSGDSPVSMVMRHVWFIGLRRHFGEIAGKGYARFFLFGRNSWVRFWGLILWHLWIGRAKHPGPASPSHHVGLEVFNVGEWLTHGDLALEAGVDFLAVVEHPLIPATVRSKWAGLKRKGLASIWAPASQDSSHVGNAGVGVISMGSGLIWKLLGLWLVVCSVPLLVSGTGSSTGGHRRDFMVGCPLAAAAVLFCKVQPDRWIAPHLAVRTFFDCCR